MRRLTAGHRFEGEVRFDVQAVSAMRLMLWLLLLPWTAAAWPARAEPSRLDSVLTRQVLRIGTTGDYRPFSELDKATGEYSGFDIDMGRSLAAALGVKVEFIKTTWANLAGDLSSVRYRHGRGVGDSRSAKDRVLLVSIPAGRQDADRALRAGGQVSDASSVAQRF